MNPPIPFPNTAEPDAESGEPKPPARPLPWPAASLDRTLFVVFALGAAATIGSLVRFWGIRPEYADRFLVLLGSLWAAYRLLPAFAAAPIRPRPFLAIPVLLLGAALVPFGWFLQVQSSGGRSAVLWFQGGGLLLLIAGTLLARCGYPRLRAIAFPLVFACFALPLPSTLLAPLQMQLQDVMTTIAHRTLPLFGIPVLQRDGFVLRLHSGDVGIAEACSGVRSLTALTALAAFIAHLRGFGPLRGFALFALSIPLVAAVNAVRVILSGMIQEWIGVKYIRGEYHEGLGLAMVFLGLGLIAKIAKWIGPSEEEGEPMAMPEPRLLPAPGLGGWIAAGAVAVALTLAVAGVAKGMMANREFIATAPLEELSPTLGEGRYQWRAMPIRPKPKPDEEPSPLPDYEGVIPEFVSEILGQDKGVFRMYENNIGQPVFVWVLFWSTADMVKGYHHPDVCWVNKGFVSEAKRVESILPPSGGEIPATVREFTRDNPDHTKEMQYVLYWTQEGPRVWDERDELRAQAGGFYFYDPKLWFGDSGRGPNAAANGRIVVLIHTPRTDAASKAETQRFAAMMAQEIYRVCPWAGPPQPSAQFEAPPGPR